MTEIAYTSVVGTGVAADLSDHRALRSLAVAALDAAGGSLVSEVVHEFIPHGLTVVLIAAESHLVLSTWPEFQTVTLDLALCGDAEGRPACDVFSERLAPAHVQIREWSVAIGHEEETG